jgi:hypothetical protein
MVRSHSPESKVSRRSPPFTGLIPHLVRPVTHRVLARAETHSYVRALYVHRIFLWLLS